MNDLYYMPIFLAFLIALYMLLTHKKININSNYISRERRYENELLNELYHLSFRAPFSWFIANEEHKKSREINKMISEAGYSNKIGYRNFTVIQLMLIVCTTIIFFISCKLIDNSQYIFKILFNIDVNLIDNQNSIKSLKIGVAIILLIIMLIPKIYLKVKAKRNRYNYIKDIPIVQMFIILMIRAKRPLKEVLYVLAKTNTMYKKTFETGYRIFLRNSEEGLEYIKNNFVETKFEDTIKILKGINEYSKSDTIILLENNLKETVEITNNLKRKNDISKLIYSQGSLFIPFLAVILLVLIPIAMYGASFLDKAM